MGSACNLGFFAEDVEKNFIFCGKNISFTEDYIRYASAKAVFVPEARKTIAIMERNFEDEIGDLGSFVENGPSWIIKTITPFVEFTMEQLSLNGCYGIAIDDFMKNYVLSNMDDLEKIHEEMSNELAMILEAQEEKNEYRVARREFNTIFNESDDLGERIWNGLGRVGDEIANTMKAAEIYNEDVQKKIKNEFRWICYSMVDFFASALYDLENLDLRDPVSGDEYKRSKAILNNLLADKIPESKAEEAAIEAFSIMPYNEKLLTWALFRYGDKDGEIEKIAKAFKLNISDAKKSLLKDAFDSIDFSTEETTLKGKEIYLKAEKEIGCTCEDYIATIEDKLAVFDLEARTVHKVEYKTREEAAHAQELYDLYKKMPKSTEEELLKSKSLFDKKSKEYGIEISEINKKIKKKLEEFDLEYRTVEDVVYDSRELADKMKALCAYYDSLELDTEEKALNARAAMTQKAKELNIDDYSCYERLEKLIAKYDSDAKHIAGQFFESRAEADKQRVAYKIYKESNFTDSLENAKKTADALIKYSTENGINVQWLLIDVESAMRHFADLSRICFQYTYETPEKAQEAKQNENLFFLAVWSLLNRSNRSGTLKKQASLVNTINSVMNFMKKTIQSTPVGYNDINQAYKVFNLHPTEQIFTFLPTDIGNSATTGFAITSSGIFWTQGSSVMSQISGTKIFGTLLGQKKENSNVNTNHQIQRFWISWSEIISMPGEIFCSPDNKLMFPDGRTIDAKTINLPELKNLFDTIRGWAKTTTINFTDSPKYFYPEYFQDLPCITPLPKVK